MARYLEDDVEARKSLARTLATSYDRRSRIVHGDKPKPDISEVTRQTGEILRRALRRMLEGNRKVDLEALDLA